MRYACIALVIMLLIYQFSLFVTAVAASRERRLEFTHVSSGFNNVSMLLRDIKSAVEDNKVATLVLRGGLTQHLYYAESNYLVDIKMEEDIILNSESNNGLLNSHDVYHEVKYSGASVVSSFVTKDASKITVATYTLFGRRSFVHSVIASTTSDSITLLFTIATRPQLVTVIQYPYRGVILGYDNVSLAIWIVENASVTSEVLDRSNLLLRITATEAHSPTLTLLFVIREGIGQVLSDAENYSSSYIRLIGESVTYFQNTFTDLPLVDIGDNAISQAYALSMLLRLNRLAANGISYDGLNDDFLDLWITAQLFPFINTEIVEASIIGGLSKHVENLQLTGASESQAEELALLAMSLEELLPYRKDVVFNLYHMVNNLAYAMLNNVVNFNTTLLEPRMMPNVGKGEYGILYALLAKASLSLARISKELNNDFAYAFYINMYNKITGILDTRFFIKNHYLYVIKDDNSIIEDQMLAPYTSFILIVNDLMHKHEHEKYLINALYSLVLNHSKLCDIGLTFYIAVHSLITGGYLDESYDLIIESFLQLIRSDKFQDSCVKLSYDYLVLRGYLGLSIVGNRIEINTSLPSQINKVESQLLLLGRKLKYTVYGSGSIIEEILVNEIQYNLPYIPLEELWNVSSITVRLGDVLNSIMKVLVSVGQDPVDGALVRVILNSTRSLTAFTNSYGEAYFIIPRGYSIVVIVNHGDMSISASMLVNSPALVLNFTLPSKAGESTSVMMLPKLLELEERVLALQERVGILDSEITTVRVAMNALNNTMLSRYESLSIRYMIVLIVMIGILLLFIGWIAYLLRSGVSLKVKGAR